MGTDRVHLTDARGTWLSFKTQDRKQLAVDIRSEDDRPRPMGLAPGNTVINVHHYYFYSTLHEYVSHLSKHFLHLQFCFFLDRSERKAFMDSSDIIMCQMLYFCVYTYTAYRYV